MDTTNSLLDRLAAKHGGCSDYRLAKILGIQTSAVGNYRSGRSRLGDDVALKVARELGLAPGYVLACMMAERASAPEIRKVWASVAKAAGRAAAIVAALAMLNLGQPGGAAQAASALSERSIYTLCALRRGWLRRRRKRHQLPLFPRGLRYGAAP